MINQENLVSGVSFREYQDKDAREIQDCLLVLQDYVHAMVPQLVATGREVYDSYFEYLLDEVAKKDGKIFIAEINNKIIAFIGFFFTQEPYETAKSLYISDLVVLEKYRGAGLGTKLLTYADNYVKEREAKFIKISALAKNLGALDLYRKIGFEDYSISLIKIL